MTQRIPLDHLTSDQYDELCDQLAALQAVARGYCPDCGRGDAGPTAEDWEQQRKRADRAEAALALVRSLVDECEARGVSSGYPLTVTRLRDALDQPGPATAGHRYLSTGCWHGDHAYCQSMTGLNGSKRPGECKHCQAKCTCGCHRPGPG